MESSGCEELSGRPILGAVLKRLSRLGIKSLMVEGGSSVIQSFLRTHSENKGTSTEKKHGGEDSGVVDKIVVTISPKIVGMEGLGFSDSINFSSSSAPSLNLKTPVYQQFGSDIVMAARI
ncbi:hypothetical protein AYI68_g2304 [Smittium mucronatum]|uniref:Bacterial bifunctional deaminase-reductase C-terminal domain-containing protein n=1 Tax=Smittium mucronatum TaxID=133383 RepID=A0A1R0H352_9FUNG|nr:hypothetical protein AYI68_g2304 [Smittium mucronatum]